MTDQPEPFPGVFPGTVATPPDVPRLVAASDLVCIGRVVEHRDEGSVVLLVNGEPVEFRRVAIRIDVERVVEGVAEEHVQLELLELDESSGLPSLRDGERVLLFLVRRDDRFALTDLVSGAIVLDRPDADEVLTQLNL